MLSSPPQGFLFRRVCKRFSLDKPELARRAPYILYLSHAFKCLGRSVFAAIIMHSEKWKWWPQLCRNWAFSAVLHAPVFREQCGRQDEVMQTPGVVEMQERKVWWVNCGHYSSSVCSVPVFLYNRSSLVIMRRGNIQRLMEVLTFYHPLFCKCSTLTELWNMEYMYAFNFLCFQPLWSFSKV